MEMDEIEGRRAPWYSSRYWVVRAEELEAAIRNCARQNERIQAAEAKN